MNCEVLCEVLFFLLQTNGWKIQRWVEQAQQWMDTAIVTWEQDWEEVWILCLGVSLQQVTKSCGKCGSFHLWQFGENKGQKLPAGLDPGIAASGTSDIHGIGVLTWLKPPTSLRKHLLVSWNVVEVLDAWLSCEQWELPSHLPGSEDIGT